MSTIDRKMTTLAIATNSSGSINDLEYKWLGMQGATGSTLNDLWMDFLYDRGYTTGSLQDRLYAHLVGTGLTQTTVGDLLYAYWVETNPEAFPTLFSFNQQLTALPAALTAMSATFTRASTATVVQNGAIVSLASGQFGTTYDSVAGMYGYASEPAATNLQLYSELFTGAGFVSASLSGTTTSPSGGTAYKLLPAVASSQHRMDFLITTSVAAYTSSCFFKAGGYNFASLRLGGNGAAIDLTTGATSTIGTVSNVLAVPLSNGWWRLSFTSTATGSDNARYQAESTLAVGNTFTGNGISGIYVWGAMVETGSRATSYIPTAAATATRAASVLSVPLANIPGFTAAQYTLFADVRCDSPFSGLQSVVVLSDGTAGVNAAIIRRKDTSEDWQFVDFSASAAVVVISSASGQTRTKLALSGVVNDWAASKNGSIVGTDTSAAMPVSPTVMRIGLDGAGVVGQFNGFIFRAGIITRALTQAQINGLTL